MLSGGLASRARRFSPLRVIAHAVAGGGLPQAAARGSRHEHPAGGEEHLSKSRLDAAEQRLEGLAAVADHPLGLGVQYLPAYLDRAGIEQLDMGRHRGGIIGQ